MHPIGYGKLIGFVAMMLLVVGVFVGSFPLLASSDSTPSDSMVLTMLLAASETPLPQSSGSSGVGVGVAQQMLAGSEVALRTGVGAAVEFSDSADDDGLAPVWPFRGIVDFGKDEDGEFVLRFWDTESGVVHDVPLGAMSEGEPCWFSVNLGSLDHYSDIYATEEFVLARFADDISFWRSRDRWHVVVPWGDEAYPVVWPEILVESGLDGLSLGEGFEAAGFNGFSPASGLDPLPLGEGFEVSFAYNDYPDHKGVLHLVAPRDEAYYDWELDGLDYDYMDEYPQEVADEVISSECDRISYEFAIGVGLMLGEPPSDPVDFFEFSSVDHPRFYDYNEWVRGALQARFDGTDGYHYGFTIIIPALEGGGISDLWSFVVAGDTGEVVACRRVSETAVGPLLVKPEGWPDLVDRFVLPEAFSGSVFSGSVFSGSDCTVTGELLNLPFGGGS
ncbi:MAG: hypothetical protein OXI96_06275 [Acidimicrobiaceae bacterium]|nr:hypothetical protein [Acidimicrobiaceae bacterium]